MKLKIQNIQERIDLLEIRNVDDVVVSRYRQAMRNGDKFPPLVVTTDYQLVCGYHRIEAYRQEYGDDKAVVVQVKSFDSEADLIAYAVKDNSKHGLQLTGISRKRAITKLVSLNVSPEEVGQIMGISVKRVEEMAGMSVVVRNGKSKGNKPVKRGLEHIAGKEVDSEQYEQHIKRDRGVPAKQNAEQLMRWLQNGWIDLEDQATVDTLLQLKKEIGKFVK